MRCCVPASLIKHTGRKENCRGKPDSNDHQGCAKEEGDETPKEV